MKLLNVIGMISLIANASVFAIGDEFMQKGTDCGTIKSVELTTGVDGRQYISFSTSDPQQMIKETNPDGTTGYSWSATGQSSLGGTLYRLPEDPSLASLIYASFERALYNQTIHFYATAVQQVHQADAVFDPIRPDRPDADAVLVTRYNFRVP